MIRATLLAALLVTGCCALPSLGATATPSTVAPTTEVGTAIVGGVASFYDYHPGEAAAGPLLRELLGSGWRGTVVRVHYREAYVDVALTDACQCFRGTPDERLIDLSRASFSHLASTEKGLLEVQVEIP